MNLLTIMAIAALAGTPQPKSIRPALKIDHATMTKVADEVDGAFRVLWPEYPCESVGTVQFLYIKGFGAIFSGNLNLAPGLNVTPFHPTISKDDVTRTKSKKLERMPALRAAMQDILIREAGKLRDVPDNEEVALGVSLFYWHWEDHSGLPDQVVMHAPKKALLAAAQDKSSLASVLQVDEF